MTTTLGALSVGPAASAALSSPEATARETITRVHSVFPSLVNLRVGGAAVLVAITGPSGACYPHAVALERAVDFTSLRPAAGGSCSIRCGEIRLTGQGGSLTIAFRQAERPKPRVLPDISFRANAWRASARRLDACQPRSSCDFRLSALVADSAAAAPFAAVMQRSARALGRAAAVERPSAGLSEAVSSLVGAGKGLTPAGDDFLAGFMAASHAAGRQTLTRALGQAITANLAATGDISASLLRCAVQGWWLTPLADLADALAADNEPAALRAVDGLCLLGHSSGADIAAGFLFGAACLLREPALGEQSRAAAGALSRYARSKRSRFITLLQAATKSFTNFSSESSHA